MSLTVVGTLIGLGLAMLASRFLETMLFGVSRLDAVTYVSVVALLALTSAIACWMPAWRASRLDPNAVLQSRVNAEKMSVGHQRERPHRAAGRDLVAGVAVRQSATKS